MSGTTGLLILGVAELFYYSKASPSYDPEFLITRRYGIREGLTS